MIERLINEEIEYCIRTAQTTTGSGRHFQRPQGMAASRRKLARLIFTKYALKSLAGGMRYVSRAQVEGGLGPVEIVMSLCAWLTFARTVVNLPQLSPNTEEIVISLGRKLEEDLRRLEHNFGVGSMIDFNAIEMAVRDCIKSISLETTYYEVMWMTAIEKVEVTKLSVRAAAVDQFTAEERSVMLSWLSYLGEIIRNSRADWPHEAVKIANELLECGEEIIDWKQLFAWLQRVDEQEKRLRGEISPDWAHDPQEREAKMAWLRYKKAKEPKLKQALLTSFSA